MIPGFVSRRAAARACSAMLLAGAASAAGTAVAAAGVRTIAVEPQGSKIAAYGGVLAWSHYVASRGDYRLLARVHGRDLTLPVGPRSVPFDVSLGPGPDGRTTAVYSRCRRESAVWTAGETSARLPLPRGCTIFAYDLEARRERRVLVGRRALAGYLPSIWRDQLAYARISGSGKPSLVLQRLPPAVRRGARGRAVPRAGALPGGESSFTGPGPVGLSLRGDTLAIDWQGGDRAGDWSSDLLLDTLPSGRGRARQVTIDSESAGPSAPGFLLAPTIDSAGIGYGAFDGSPILPPGDAFKRTAPSGDGAVSARAPHELRAVAFDGSVAYALYGSRGAGGFGTCAAPGCRLIAERGLSYS